MTTILSNLNLIKNLRNVFTRKVYIIQSTNPISTFFVSLPKRNQNGRMNLFQLCKGLLNGSRFIKDERNINQQIINKINIGKETQNFGLKDMLDKDKKNQKNQDKKVSKNQKDTEKQTVGQKVSDNQEANRKKHTADKSKQGQTFQKPSQQVKTSQKNQKQSQKPAMQQSSKTPSPMKGSFQQSQQPQRSSMSPGTPGQSSELGPPPSQGYYSQADRYDEDRCKQNPASNPQNICLEDKDNEYTQQSQQVQIIIQRAVFTHPSIHDQSYRKDQCEDYHRKGQSKFLKECQDALSHAGATRYKEQAQEPMHSAENPEQPYPARENTIKKTDQYSSSGGRVDKPLPEQQKASSRKNEGQKTSERFQKSQDQKQIKKKSQQYPKDVQNPSKQSASFSTSKPKHLKQFFSFSTSKPIDSTNRVESERNQSKGPFEKKSQVPQFQAKKQTEEQKQHQIQDEKVQLNIMTNWNAQSGQTNSPNQQKESQQQGELIYKMDPFMRDKRLQEQGKAINLTEQPTDDDSDSNKRYTDAYKDYQQKSKEFNKKQCMAEQNKKKSTSQKFKQYNKQINQTTGNTTNQNIKYKFSTSNKTPKDPNPGKNPNQQNVKDQIKGTDYDKSFTQKVKDKADEYLNVKQYFSSGQQQKDQKPIAQKIKQKADEILKTDQNKKYDDKTMTEKVKQTIKEKVDNVLGSDKGIIDQIKEKVQQTSGNAKQVITEKAGEAKETIKEKAGQVADMAGKVKQTIKDKAGQVADIARSAKDNIKEKAQKAYEYIQTSDKKGEDKSMSEKAKQTIEQKTYDALKATPKQPRQPKSEPFNKTYEGYTQNINKEDNKKAGIQDNRINPKNQAQPGKHETKQTQKNKANQNPNDGNQKNTKPTKPNQFKFGSEKRNEEFTVDNPPKKKVNDLDDPASIQQPIDKANQGKQLKQENKEVIQGQQGKKEGKTQDKKSDKNDEKKQEQTKKQSSKDRDMKKDQDTKGAKRTQDQIPSYNKFTNSLLDLLIVKKKDLVI